MACPNDLCKFKFCWICLKEVIPGSFEIGGCTGLKFIRSKKDLAYVLQKKFHRLRKIINVFILLSYWNFCYILCGFFQGLTFL